MSVRGLALAVLGVLAVAGFGVGLVEARPGPATMPQRLRELALAADRAFDASPGWQEARRELPPKVTDIAAFIVAQMAEEGIPDASLPTNGVSWADMGADRSDVLGAYSAWSDELRLNERYVRDPGWPDRPWLNVLVHELVHAQGLRDEARTEAVAIEVTAALCDVGWRAACTDLWDLLRYDAALILWWSEAYGAPIPLGFAGATGLRPCPPAGCPRASGDVPAFDELRRRLFTAREWAAIAKRLRTWLAPTQAYDYGQVVETYVARVLPTLLAAGCGGGAITVAVPPMTRYGVGPTRPARTLTVPVDDLAFQAQELGWRC